MFDPEPEQKPNEHVPVTVPFRMHGELHDRLMTGTRSAVAKSQEPLALPVPVYPRRNGTEEPSGFMYHANNGVRAVRRWFIPYVESRFLPGSFRPLLSYLFTDWKCNLQCHYCWAFDNRVKGMTEDTAKRSIDWLHSVGCRVIAIMGGEPLIRPDFIHKIVDYGTQRGFFVYLPTNGRLMRPDVIDRIGDAGVSAVNLAIDCVQERPGLPKALEPIRSYFDYLVKKQRQYGYMVVLNINITRHNMEDVVQLTEIAREAGISTDYHINEAPMMEQKHFAIPGAVETFIRPEDWTKVDALLDVLIEKNRQGYVMVNSKAHLARMKEFMRGRVETWQCRAGHNSCLIRTDGTLSPCFPTYSAQYRLGHDREPEVRRQAARRHEDGVQQALPVHVSVRAGLLLQHHDRDALDHETDPAQLRRAGDRRGRGVRSATAPGGSARRRPPRAAAPSARCQAPARR